MDLVPVSRDQGRSKRTYMALVQVTELVRATEAPFLLILGFLLSSAVAGSRARQGVCDVERVIY
jgi:hypothetical protein